MIVYKMGCDDNKKIDICWFWVIPYILFVLPINYQSYSYKTVSMPKKAKKYLYGYRNI